MAYATIVVRFVYLITGIDPGTADEESWEGGTRITGCLIFRLVYRKLSFCIVIVVLAPSGDRAVPASLDCMIFFVDRTLPVTIICILLLPQCLLQMETGRGPHCLICCIIHDACSTLRQGGARITVLSDLCTSDINGYGAVG